MFWQNMKKGDMPAGHIPLFITFMFKIQTLFGA